MSNAISAQGTIIQISNAAATQAGSPTQFVTIGEVITFSRDGDRAEIDVSSLDSTAKEFRLGLQDFGTFSFEANWVPADPGQVKLVAALASSDPWDFKITYPNGSIHYFRGLVKQFNFAGGVDQVVKRTGQIRLTGPVTEV